MTDGIPNSTLWLARGLSMLAYTGVMIFLPATVVAAVTEKVARITTDVVEQAAAAWGDIG